jgi:adenylate cyclase class 2
LKSRNEVEIKFAIPDLDELTRKLEESGFEKVTPRTHEMNVLYDLPGHPLRNRGELLRLRQYGSDWILTHKSKGKAGPHKSRAETETTVSDGQQMTRILEALGFRPSFRYEKFRAEWKDSTGHVVVDQTPIGNLGEIEGPPRWIDRTARKLGIPRHHYITKSYAELFFDWKKAKKSPAREMTFSEMRKKR